MDHQQVRCDEDLGDRREVLDRIERQLGVQAGIVAFATRSVAMLLPAPVMSSTVTGTPQLSESLAASRRAATSGAVPGVKPTMMRTGRFG
jgi:hypothetical protein